MPGTTALTSDIVFFAVFGLLHSKGASDPADYCTEKKERAAGIPDCQADG